jgi:uncharacterized protein
MRGANMEGIVQVAQLVHTCGKIEGRKKLQKIVHILQCLGHPFQEEFDFLHFGPYSPRLREELDQLKKLNLIQEQESHTPAVGYPQYDCTPSETLGKQLRELGLAQDPGWAELARDLNRLQTPLLEAMSTIMFLQRRGFEDERLRERFKALKPALDDRFDGAMQRIERLPRAATAA